MQGHNDLSIPSRRSCSATSEYRCWKHGFKMWARHEQVTLPRRGGCSRADKPYVAGRLPCGTPPSQNIGLPALGV